MKKSMILGLLLACMTSLTAQRVEDTSNGIRVYFDSQDVTQEVQFYADGIVRIVKYPGVQKPEKKSYSVIMTPRQVTLQRSEKAGNVILASANVEVRMDKNTGKICFYSLKGEQLLSEKEYGASFVPVKDGRKDSYRVVQDFMLGKDEIIYGLGQQQTGLLNQRNQSLMLRNENTRVCIPYITSEKGYCVYWDNPAPTVFADSKQNTSFESEVGYMADYYFLYTDGTQDQVIANIRELSGQATMLPLWTLGFWQCRERYKSSDELCEVLDKYRELEIPLDGIVQDWQYWGCDSN